METLTHEAGMNFREHVEKWKNCTKCELHKGRQRVVFARGKIPCHVLFIGEAPGESEDVLGYPFQGPAGKLLDGIVARALGHLNVGTAFTNLVCCIPRGEDGGKTGEPLPKEIRTCSDRLQEFLTIARPRLVVCVGSLSKSWVMEGLKNGIRLEEGVKTASVTHPAAILRMNVAQRGLETRRCEVVIRRAVEALSEG